MSKKTVDLVQGTLEFLILKTLSRGTPMHGFNILQWIYEITDETLQIEEGSLYPALHRMETRKWIKADWAVSEKRRRAKYYMLTAAGKKRLTHLEDQWNLYTAAVEKIVASAEA